MVMKPTTDPMMQEQAPAAQAPALVSPAVPESVSLDLPASIETLGFVVVFPNVINSLELLVSTVMYSFDPCFTVKASVVLSTVLISTVFDTVTKVVDE